MMQETGNNALKNRILSIRLSSDGLYFWYGDHSGDEQLIPFSNEKSFEEELRSAIVYLKMVERKFDLVRYYEDTLKNVMIPTEFYDQTMADKYLAVNNIEVEDGESVAEVCLSEEIICLLVYKKPEVDRIAELTNSKVEICSFFNLNLLRLQQKDHELNCVIRATASYAYITMNDNSSRLAYCDVLRWNSKEDILFYLRNLETQFDMKSLKLEISGYNTEDLVHYLRKFYKEVRCE